MISQLAAHGTAPNYDNFKLCDCLHYNCHIMKKLVSKIILRDIVSQASSTSKSYFLMLEEFVDSAKVKLIKSYLISKDSEIKCLKLENTELKRRLSGIIIKLEKDHSVMQNYLRGLRNITRGVGDE